MRILVTGASGAIGACLAGRLLADGHDVRAMARRAAPGGLEDVRRDNLRYFVADALTGSGLARALEDVEVAYYLIHSMERTSEPAGSYPQRDRRAASNFATAAARAGVGRIVYLGGPRVQGREPSRHLASRRAIEEILAAAVADTVILRGSIVIGARSRSFRLMVRLIERMPVLALPTWRTYRTRPIDARDVTEMLTACATVAAPGHALEACGPQTLTFEAMLTRIAELMLLRRPALRLPVGGGRLTAGLAAAIAGEDPELVTALTESLGGDLLPIGEPAAGALGVRLHSFDAAVEHALGEWERREPLAAR
jgi:uncharacterized protein YbjT (DUF2867 family)